LAALECDVLVIFGNDDPWCKPAFAKKMLETLDQRHPDRVHRYVELSDVGHCPNHEAPRAVAQLLRRWTDASSASSSKATTATTTTTTTTTTTKSSSSRNGVNENNIRRTVELVEGGKQVFSEPYGDILVQERSSQDIPVSLIDKFSTVFLA